MPDLTELRRLLEGGTPRPWERVSAGEVSGGDRLLDDVISAGPVSCMSYCYGGSSAVEMTDADSALIVAAVNALPALVAAAEALDRMRALHVPILVERGSTRQMVQVCEACFEVGHELYPDAQWNDAYPDATGWPCPTIRAIDGEPQP